MFLNMAHCSNSKSKSQRGRGWGSGGGGVRGGGVRGTEIPPPDPLLSVLLLRSVDGVTKQDEVNT